MRSFPSLFLAACILSASLSASPAAERLNFSWPVNVGPLNPHLYSPNQMFAQSMVYEPLVKYQRNGTLAPWLAQSWEISEDGRVYTFHLREGVTFSNGEPFDAAAVVANIDAVLAVREQHNWLELANQIETAEALDPGTVRLTLKDAYYPILEELALPRPFRFVAPSQFVDGGTKDGIEAPIGTGPWVLQETRLGEHDLFRRNKTYWGDEPAFDEVNVKVIPDPNTRAVAMETGEIDLIYGTEGPISPDTFERFRAAGQFTTELSQPIETRVFALNTDRGPTGDLAVRRAINHAIDKDTMIATVLYGTQERADALFSPRVPYADVGLEPYAYDPEGAVRLLEDAGWAAQGDGVRERDGEPLVIELNYFGTDAVVRSIAEVIQADLARVGIGITLVGEEESSVYARQRDGRFGMILNQTWGAPFDPHAFFSSMRVPSHADYQAQLGLADKDEIDAEIGEVLTTSDEAERTALYADILTRLHEEAVYLPLTFTNIMAVARPELGAIPFGAMASDIPFEDIRPEGR
ncbi:nickel ABC transporter substrate-binding protein [Aureimonas mangrovi]|uniref:nickel ABC transporter substrate-binding protein n=1 Tax=Aureimonas mangrovi TaxID=2758041 RepID=UPI00163D6D72|nr:nickel ABC transporter substrate-binding protein [Aureimonas mangrovi]